MKRPSHWLFAAGLLMASHVTPRVAAEQLQGELKVLGRTIEIQVRHEDGRPAAGVQVRLLHGRQLTAASARTNSQGRWVHVMTQAGDYEVVIEPGSSGGEERRLHFTMLQKADPEPMPWPIILGGVAGLLLAVMLVWSRKLRWSAGVTTAVGVGCLGWACWIVWFQPSLPDLSPGPDVAQAARTMLLRQQVTPLSAPLAELLADDKLGLVQTQPHSLLGRSAPDFELTDHVKKPLRLSERWQSGPVVLVFYYGYHCNHCVSQLFALHDDIEKFHELGAEVIAVSADPSSWTNERFKEYGPFAFPVLADPGNKIAQVYGVYRPASGKTPEDLQHGTFVVGRDGLVHWAQFGNEPFTGNRTLLFELARLAGRLPAKKK